MTTKTTNKPLTKAQNEMLATIYMCSIGGRSYTITQDDLGCDMWVKNYPEQMNNYPKRITLIKTTFQILLDKQLLVKITKPSLKGGIPVSKICYELTPQGVILGNEVRTCCYTYDKLNSSTLVEDITPETTPSLVTMAPRYLETKVREYLGGRCQTLTTTELDKLVSMLKKLDTDMPTQITRLVGKEAWFDEIEQAAWQFAYDQHCEATTNA